MKRHVQSPGVRKWSGNDLLDLQGEGLAIADRFFAQYGDRVICGCQVTDEGGIAAGLVSLGGLVMPLDAIPAVELFPVYLVPAEERFQREYADNVVRDIAVRHYAKAVQAKPGSGNYIEIPATGVKPFLELTNEEWILQFQEKLKALAAADTSLAGRVTVLEKKMPSFLDHIPGEEDDGYYIGSEVWTVDEDGEKTFWRCHDNTENAAVWRPSGSGSGVSANIEELTLTLTSNQAQPDMALYGLEIHVRYGENDIALAWNGTPLSAAIPADTPYTVEFPELEGYTRPSNGSYTALAGYSREVTAAYNTTVLTIDVTSNQADKSDLDGLQIVLSGSVSKTLTYTGAPLVQKVPLGEEVTITPAQVEGYAEVRPVTKTPANASETVSFTYNTTLLTIDVASNQSDKSDLNGLQITLSGSVSKTLTYTGSPLVQKVPLGEEVTITPAQVEGYAAVQPVTRTPANASETVTLSYSVTLLTIDVTSNQSDKSDLDGLQIVLSGSVAKTLTYEGSPLILKVPTGQAVTVSPAQLDRYSPVQPVTRTPGNATDSISFTYNTTLLTVTLASNQGDDPALNAGTTVALASGTISETLTWTGTPLKVKLPPGQSYTLTPSALEGYKSPSAKSGTATGATMGEAFLYQTEVVTVTLNAFNSASCEGQKVTINGQECVYAGTPISVKIPFDTSYSVSADEKEGFLKPDTQSFTASQTSRPVSMVYGECPSGVLVFDKSISDPANITGDINSGVIATILSKFRRCLCKKTAEGEVTIAYLQNDNSNYYEDGTPAKLDGTEGDVMVNLPEFYYKWGEVDENKFSYDLSEGDKGLTYKHVTRSLVGAYKGYVASNKLYSRSAVNPTGNRSANEFESYATARGQGYQCIDFQQHCVIAFMLYAKYGTRDVGDILGWGGRVSGSSAGVTGSSNATGIIDTEKENSKYVCGLGIEGVFGGIFEWVKGVEINNNTWKITDPDGSTRNVKAEATNGWVENIAAESGPFFDMVPTKVGSSSTTGYSDYYDNNNGAGGPFVLARSFSWESPWYGGVAFATTNKGASYAHSEFGSRLAFRGLIHEAESVAAFKALPLL